MEVDVVTEQNPIGISQEIVQTWEAKAEVMIQNRKQTKPPSEYPGKKEIGKYKFHT